MTTDQPTGTGAVGGGATPRTALRVSGASIAAAGTTVCLLLLWFKISDWYLWRSRFTDLPGQDSHGLLLNLEKYVVMGLIAVVAGRIGGLLALQAKWVAAIVGVVPLLVLFSVSGQPFSRWYWFILAPLISLLGAYGGKVGLKLHRQA